MEWQDKLKKQGIRVKLWSDGKPFNPVLQERTDAMDDILKAKEKRDEHTGPVVQQDLPDVPDGVRQD
jgi:hypothetical protein